MTPRQLFKESVFYRDHSKCVVCGAPGVDAHHILERRLFPDGGYLEDNGVTLCAACHLEAEATRISCSDLRARAGIGRVVLPSHLYVDQEYDKWGNPILPSGQRLPGELFDDPSVQKTLRPFIHLFINRVKYPRTFHFPWSPNLQNDDRMLQSTAGWEGTEVVITEKMDGENTTMYNDYIHARSLDSPTEEWRERVKAIWGGIAHEIPPGFRICGENVAAVHSIRYDDLLSYFLVYGIWDKMTCLSWSDTMEWCGMLGLATVPLIYWGTYSDDLCKELCSRLNPATQEGLVVRPAGAFLYREFPTRVGKFVRARHVQTNEHWTRKKIEYNIVGV